MSATLSGVTRGKLPFEGLVKTQEALAGPGTACKPKSNKLINLPRDLCTPIANPSCAKSATGFNSKPVD